MAVQLRTGDSAKGSISGDSSDKRPVLRDKAWGLQSPEARKRGKPPGSLRAELGDLEPEANF